MTDTPPSDREPSSRSLAADILVRVIEQGGYSQRSIDAALRGSTLSTRDRAFCTHLVYGTLTWLGAIDQALDDCLRDGLRSLPPRVRALLRIGTHELLFFEVGVATHAVVHEAVELIGAEQQGRYRKLANAVLRRLDRQREGMHAAGARLDESVWRHGLPSWIWHRLTDRLGKERAAAVMDAWNAPTHVWLRQRRPGPAEREELLTLLSEAGASPEPHPIVPDACIIHGSTRLPGVVPERAIVQDAGAQLVGYALPTEVVPMGARLLDACAGLGGKTLHLLDRFPEASVIAADIDARKLTRIPSEDPRLTRSAGDIRDPDFREQLKRIAPDGFDALLLDAPCSALGTIGRHPEVRWRRKEEDILAMSRIQQQLLDSCTELVRPGGWLIYAVCTFSDEETRGSERVIDQDPTWERRPLGDDPAVDWAPFLDDSGGATLWPDLAPCDGFHIARWQRKSH